MRTKDNATIVITHYQRLLEHIVPDFVHVLHDGRIIKSGGKELALELEEKGYDWITKNNKRVGLIDNLEKYAEHQNLSKDKK